MSTSDKKLLIVFIGVIALVCSYYFGYRNFQKSNDALMAENATLSNQAAELQEKVANEAEYVSKTAEYKNEVNVILQQFPSLLQIENEIMDVVDMENRYNVQVTSLTVADAQMISSGTEGTEVAEAAEGEEAAPASMASSQYVIYDVNSNITYTSNYRGLKDMITFIATDLDKRKIATLSASFDSTTGKLDGIVSYDDYFVTGQADKPYVEADIRSVQRGTKNIFGTVEKKSGAQTSAETPAEGASEETKTE